MRAAAPGNELAVAARTVVASTHRAHVVVPAVSPYAIGYVDDDGQPLLVVRRTDVAPRGTASLVVESLGAAVRLVGRLRSQPPGHPEVHELLRAHAECLTEADETGGVQVLRLEVGHVSYRTGAGRHEPVPVSAYGLAEPDLFAAFDSAVTRHLEQHHQHQLLTVARLRLGCGDLAGIAVRRVTRHRLDLVALTPEGARPLSIATPHLARPEEICAGLHRLAAQ